MKPSLQIHTWRLLLRTFSEKDMENVFRGLSHPEVIKYYGVHYKTLEDTKTQMDWFSELEETGTGKWWAICSEENDIFYGAIGINNLNTEHKKAELGFWLLPEFWGKGFVQEAAEAVLKYVFHSLKLHRIEAFVETGNSNSEKLLNKLNFNYEGEMKECEIKNNKYISVKIFARLNKKTGSSLPAK